MDDKKPQGTQTAGKKKAIIFDYKDPLTLAGFITEGGKILPSRLNRLSHKRQKALKNSIKKARRLSLLPVGTVAYDSFGRVEAISKKPFSID